MSRGKPQRRQSRNGRPRKKSGASTDAANADSSETAGFHGSGVHSGEVGDPGIEARLRARTERLVFLSETTGDFLTTTSPGALLDKIFTRMSALLDLEVYFHFIAKSGGKGRLELAACGGVSDTIADSLGRGDLDQTLCGRVSREKEPILLENVQQSTEPETRFIRSIGVTAYVCFPLMAGRHFSGTLSFGSRSRTRIDEESLSLIQTICKHMAAAIGRKQAEDEIHQLNVTLEQKVVQRTREVLHSERALAAFFANAPIGLLWVNPEGRILRVNHAFLRILNLPENAVLGHPIVEFDAGGELDAPLPISLRDEDVIQNQRARLQCKDGTPAHVLIDATAIREGGRLIRTDWFVQDISRRIELERQMLEVAEQERQQVGRELHDDLGQILHGSHFLSAELQTRMQEKGLEEAVELGRINRFLDEALATTRCLAHGLQPVPPVPEGLVNALRDLAARIRKVYKIDCRFVCPDPVEVGDPKVATHLYRIAQEATSNSIKHAKCTRITIRLKAVDSRLILGIRDNGTEDLPPSVSRRGIGLQVMQFRAAAVNGSLVVQNVPEGGTEVVCILTPVPPDSNEDATAPRHERS